MSKLFSDAENVLFRARDVIKRIKELRGRLKSLLRRYAELRRMLRHGELDKETYEKLSIEVVDDMCNVFEKYISCRDDAKRILVDLRVVHTKFQMFLKDFDSGKVVPESEWRASPSRLRILQEISSLKKHIDLITKILNEVNVEDEVIVLNTYLDRGLTPDKRKTVESFFKDLYDVWSSRKIALLRKMESLKSKIESIDDKLREHEIRFAIGEYDQLQFNSIRIKLESQRSELTDEIARIQDEISRVDTAFYNCMRILGGAK